MQMRAIVLSFSCTALSLTLTAPVSMSVPQQAEEQRGRDEIQGSSAKEKTAKKKIAEESAGRNRSRPPARGFKELGKEFLIDQKQIWTSPAKIRFSDTQWLVPLSGITAGLFVTDSDFSGHLSKKPRDDQPLQNTVKRRSGRTGRRGGRNVAAGARQAQRALERKPAFSQAKLP